ncbi:hypothetical protein [Arcobacter sp. YIC-80]|uniref:hypothetical protein n=1 Tax=unclassified Arcobacter TaxID=2593671 RepID=UPI00384EAE17
MKKLLLFTITPFICFAQMDDYMPLSKFSNEKKIEYNFVEKKQKQKKVKPLIKKVKPFIKKEKNEQKVLLSPMKKEVEVIKVRENILNDEVKQEDILEEKNSITIDNTIVEVRFEYSPIDIDISNATTSLSENANAFSPILSYQNNKNKFTFEFFMTDKKFETKLYKLNYKRIFDKLQLGVGLNRYELTANSQKAKENYFDIQANYRNEIQAINNLWFDVEGSIGTGDKIDALEYKFTLGYQNNQFKESSYILGYKGKEFESDGIDMSYKGPFIGIQTQF